MSRAIPTTLLLATLLLVPTAAQASWWNDEWTGRKPLRLDLSPTGANITEPVGSTAVLVRLTVGNFNFGAAKPDGTDLRFIAGDDKTPLKHHFEKYDSLLGEALVWVGIPELKPGARTDLWLYYGNAKAVGVEDAKGTYDSSTSLVFHFAERGQPAKDSSTWATQAQGVAPGSDALIGSGLKLDGATRVTIPAGTSLTWAAGATATFSAWVKPEEATSSGVVFSRGDASNGLVVGLDQGQAFAVVTRDGSRQRVNGTEVLAAGSWHLLAVTASASLTLFVDGAQAGSVAATLPALNGPALLGGPPAAAPPAEGEAAPAALAGFRGELDEVQLARVERTPGFLRAAFASQGADPAKFLSSGQDEEASTWSGGYFWVIIRSVTLDGWVVIGLLAIMGTVSLLVMATKALYLSAVERANARFTGRFHERRGDLLSLVNAAHDASPLGDEKVLRDATLYRLFQVVSAEVRRRSQAGRSISGAALEAIRASLDSGLVRENQRLNARLVFLTIAISGGPFLGLLGTVVGVMITFAAIAAAGDVNVNAIAPGIAAALVATVAGLVVAIPALFGYNWLLSRIKAISATMQVFCDELVTSVAEAAADPQPGPEAVPRERPFPPAVASLRD